MVAISLFSDIPTRNIERGMLLENCYVGNMMLNGTYVEPEVSVWCVDSSEKLRGWLDLVSGVFYSYRELRVVPDRRGRFWWKSEFARQELRAAF